MVTEVSPTLRAVHPAGRSKEGMNTHFPDRLPPPMSRSSGLCVPSSFVRYQAAPCFQSF